MDLMVLVGLFQFRIFCDSVILINWPTWSCTVLVFQLVLGVLPAKKKTVKLWFHHLVPHLESTELPGILWIIFKAQHFDQSSNSQQIMTTKLTQTPFKFICCFLKRVINLSWVPPFLYSQRMKDRLRNYQLMQYRGCLIWKERQFSV